jgi:UDP-2,3-diacylglucosamine hydrolase
MQYALTPFPSATDFALTLPLPPGKSVYFASDFHLGVPDLRSSRAREQKIVRWLDHVAPTASALFLVGDIFDFWFEYRYTVPKGFVRLLGKLAELSDAGLPILFFTGNHDMWMFGYFVEELNVKIYRSPQAFRLGDKTFLVGHGDGLGPGDRRYKVIKQVFRSPAAQWLFARLHPNLGMGIARTWSRSSRLANDKKGEDKFLGEGEWLWTYCREVEAQRHHDYYVFGHRHLPLDLPVGDAARYVNLGEWVHHCTYAKFDGSGLSLLTFE